MVGKRQSEYPDRVSDALDKVLACENPDPAGDNSVPGRPTAQIGITDFSGTSTPITNADSPYTLQRNNEIVLANTTAGDIVIIVPDGWPDDSKFTVVLVADSFNRCAITSAGTETFMRLIGSGVPIAAEALIGHGESVVYVKSGDTYYTQAKSIGRYIEFWAIAVDTALPELATGAAAINMTFALSSLGAVNSLLFSGSGTGVLTATTDQILTIDFQANVWMHLLAQNSNLQVLLDPVTNAVISVTNGLWTSAGSSRIESFPQSIYASWMINLVTNNTFSIEGVYSETLGSGSVELGDSGAGDTRGGLVVFTA